MAHGVPAARHCVPPHPDRHAVRHGAAAAGVRSRGDPRLAPLARAPGATGGGVSAAPVSERGGAPERATLEAATPAAPAFADDVDRAARAGRRAATLPHARERRVAARADGPPPDPPQLPLLPAGGGRAAPAPAPESDGAC